MKTQKGQLVINKIIQISIILLVMLVCFNCSKKNDDITLLEVYLKDYRKEHNVDSIFLGQDNSNLENFKSYKRYLNIKKSKDSLKNKIFTKAEYDNFNSQVITKGNWNIDLSKLKRVYLEKTAKNRNDILYITKPIYTKDKKYAILYSYNKFGKDKIYYIPLIEIYKKQSNIWRKISTLGHHETLSHPWIKESNNKK